MKKIRLSDTDIELFELEISPGEYTFFTRHKEAFRCMWKEQGLSFWKKFIITFRSFTNRHGAIREISNNSAKFEDFIDQAFIFVHENFVDGREGKAKSFIDDIAKLAQNRDRFKDLDSKSFAKDPFYMRDTRDLFRRFFGPPDQKASYLKVYVVSPIYLRFGGSVCRCLKRWLDAPSMEDGDESYWVPPEIVVNGNEKHRSTVVMCKPCLDDCSTKYFREKISGRRNGPSFIDYWTLGDPRFNDEKNPLYAPLSNEFSDWRDTLSVEKFRDFLHYAKFEYGKESNKCQECVKLSSKREDPMDSISVADCRSEGHKKKKRKKKSKVKPTSENMDNDIDDLVAHIEGEKKMEQMPVSTFAGAKVPDTVISIKKDEEKAQTKVGNKKKKLYAERAKIMEGFKSDMLQANDDLPRNSRIGGFNVVRIEDEATGSSELTISIKAIKGEEGRSPRPKMMRHHSSYPLTAQMIRSHMDNLPQMLEWYEGDCWCACVLNYQAEEKDNPTNFTIKVSGPDEDTTKRTMFKLLFYVGRRKNRPCPGWVMEDDDVVACILPDDCPDQEGLTVCIIKGFSFQDRLSKDEKMTMITTEEAERPAEKVLMTVRGKDVEKLMENENRRNALKYVLDSFGSNAINGNTLTGGTINLNEPVLDKDGKEQEQPVWNQIQKEPEKFELFFMMSKKHETQLHQMGFTTIDYSYFKKDPMNKCMPWERVFCLRCKKNRRICPCGPFRKFVELEPTRMEPVRVTKKEDLDLKLGINIRKPILQDLLNKEFEHHAFLKERDKQRLQQIRANLQSVPEADEEKAKGEMIEFIETVLRNKRRKTDDELSQSCFVDKEKPKKVLLFGSGLSKDGVSRVKFMNGDVKKDGAEKHKKTINNGDRLNRTDGNEKSESTENKNTGIVSKPKQELSISENIETVSKPKQKLSINEMEGKKKEVDQIHVAVTQKEVQEKKVENEKEKIKEKTPEVDDVVGLESTNNEDDDDDWTSVETESGDEDGEAVQLLPTKSEESNTLDDSVNCLKTQVVEKVNYKQRTSAEEEEMKLKEQSATPRPEVEVNRADLERTKSGGSLPEEDKGQMSMGESGESEQAIVKDQGIKLNKEGGMDIGVEKGPVITDEDQSAKLEEGELLIREEGKSTSLDQEEVIENNQENSFLTECHSSLKDQEMSNIILEKQAIAADQEKSCIAEKIVPAAEDKCMPATAELNRSSDINVDTSITTMMEQNSTQTDQDQNTQDELIQDQILSNEKDEKSSLVELVEKREILDGILRHCSFCDTEEPAPKTYKKCLKCKQEGIISARYYCGKKCQTSDWKLRHKWEHKENLLD